MAVLYNPLTWLGYALRPLQWLWCYQPRRIARRRAWPLRYLVYTWRLILIIVCVDLIYVWLIWPDWQKLSRGAVPKSNFIAAYEQHAAKDKKLPALKWQRTPLHWLPNHVKRAAIAGEDARFYSHSGVDIIALREAIDKNFSLRKWKYGASTISQQTVKNLYFSPERSLLRKWHELLFTLGMENNLSKDRILEIYLNIAEFGEGIYGIETAAQYYFGVSASQITERQAAELIASLPAPKKDNPAKRTRTFMRKSNGIYRWIKSPESDTAVPPPSLDENDFYDDNAELRLNDNHDTVAVSA